MNYEIQSDAYAKLFNRCRAIACQIVEFPLNGNSSGKIGFIHRSARELASCEPLPVSLDDRSEESLMVLTILDLFEANLKMILSERINLIDLIEKEPQGWFRFMTEFPLGDYGEMISRFLLKSSLLKGTVLELGAGVGNTSRKIANLVDPRHYIRTDLNIRLLERAGVSSEIAYYDFNRPGGWKDLDLVFATNALHCAADPLQSLKHVHSMLKSGGKIVLAEGTPYSTPGVPWALNFLCGIYDGWWDRGGFLPRDRWKELLLESGFSEVGSEKMCSGVHDLGGLIWASK